jgi:hypothetical protein
MNLIEGHFECTACGETNDLFVDPSGGAHQSYVEDCHVCCRPNVLVIRCDLTAGVCEIETTLES